MAGFPQGTYDVEAVDELGEDRKRTELKLGFEAPVRSGKFWRQQTSVIDPTYGTRIRDIVEWRVDGKYLISRDLLKIRYNPKTGERTEESDICTMKPAQQLVRFPLQKGDSWEWKGSCVRPDGSIKESNHTRHTVEGQRNIRIGGISYPCTDVERRSLDPLAGAPSSSIACYSAAWGFSIQTVTQHPQGKTIQTVVRA